MNAIGIIPARFYSIRFPGKVLADLCGKPLIQHVYENASASSLLKEVIIATDDSRILEVARVFNANVIMTSKDHSSGTDRIIEVVKKTDTDIVVNIQADEPMITPDMIDKLVECLDKNKDLNVVTFKKKSHSQDELFNPNVVKVVTNREDFALYFSRAVIPYISEKDSQNCLYHYKHIGIYGYRRSFLLKFAELPVLELEKIEKLEQLRILENGFKIKVIETKHETIGVDTRQDLERLKSFWNKN